MRGLMFGKPVTFKQFIPVEILVELFHHQEYNNFLSRINCQYTVLFDI